MDRLNKSGKIYLTHTRLSGKYTIRMCVAQTHTEPHHVKNAWKFISDTADQLSQELT
jgi:aromatic-L-amino-acid decarboxylase